MYLKEYRICMPLSVEEVNKLFLLIMLFSELILDNLDFQFYIF